MQGFLKTIYLLQPCQNFEIPFCQVRILSNARPNPQRHVAV
jgi:hypothetical protein